MLEQHVSKLLAGVENNQSTGFEFTSDGIYLRGKVNDRGEKLLCFVVLGDTHTATESDLTRKLKHELERRGLRISTYEQGSIDNLARTARPAGWVIGGYTSS